MDYLVERLQEPSTWRGLALLGTALGITVSPEAIQQLIIVGAGLSGLIGIVFADQPQ